MSKSLLFVLFLIGCGQCRELWSADLKEVSGFTLEKDKPIKLSKKYESVQIAQLSGTLYSDSLSQLHGVKELRITRHHLENVEKGAFCSAPDVKTLQIDFFGFPNTITYLTKDMFHNCDNLEELLLQFNDDNATYTIDNDSFEDLTSLKKFALQGYAIYHITKNFLKLNPTTLTSLSIYTADLKQVDSDVFQDLKNLKMINIQFNRNWTHLPKDLFKNLPKLEAITLRDNGLKDITWDEFEGLSSLKVLDVAANRISSFDADKIAKNMPNLTEIFIEMNPLECKQKESFVEELTKKLGHPLEASFKFDPGYFDSCEEN